MASNWGCFKKSSKKSGPQRADGGFLPTFGYPHGGKPPHKLPHGPCRLHLPVGRGHGSVGPGPGEAIKGQYTRQHQINPNLGLWSLQYYYYCYILYCVCTWLSIYNIIILIITIRLIKMVRMIVMISMTIMIIVIIMILMITMIIMIVLNLLTILITSMLYIYKYGCINVYTYIRVYI